MDPLVIYYDSFHIRLAKGIIFLTEQINSQKNPPSLSSQFSRACLPYIFLFRFRAGGLQM